MIEPVEEFGNRRRDRALDAELEVERLKAQLATQTAATEGHAGQAALRERYAIAIHDAMEPDLSLADQEPAYQALIARAAEAAMALADTGRAAVLREAAAAITDAIERDRVYSPRRSNDRAALGAAREIVLGLIDNPRPMADETAATARPFVPPVHYRRDDGVDCCVHAIPVGADSCRACRELADAEPAAGAPQDGA